MFKKLEGGSQIDIQGLICNIPPEGCVYNVLTKKLEFRGVYERSPIKEEQYWVVEPLPDWYESTMAAWVKFDKTKKDDELEFYDERLQGFINQEWDRRLNGFWYRNNGKANYLVGAHYLFLRWWHIDTGLPRYRLPDLEYFYFLDYCINDPLCMGMVEVTKRRFGKSFRAGLFALEYITRTKMTNAGIQSKTGNDAKKFFSKTVVAPFRRLPRFFRPEYDMSLGVNPKTEMRFQRTNVRGKNAEADIDKSELGSMVDWGSADKMHFDGQKLLRYVGDETGKTVETDVYERHEVVRYCLLDDEGRIIGKALYTTTVEKLDSDKDGVQDAFRLLWNESNQNAKKENGMTGTGLYRFFMSAKRTKNFSKYGIPDEVKTEADILLEREGVKDNPRSLFARTRKEPLTIEEAFSIDVDTCIFNAFNIGAQKAFLEINPKFKRPVWFYRREDGLVTWRDIKRSEKDFCWKTTYLLDQSEANKTINGRPGRMDDGGIAIDGYSNNQGGKRWGSKASAWMGRRLDINNPDETGKPFAHLYGRPSNKKTLFEQVLLGAEYYGYQAFFEFNADEYYNYFTDRDKGAYLGIFPKTLIDPMKFDSTERLKGVPTTDYSLIQQADYGVDFVERHCSKIDFEELLEEMPNFDPNNRTKYDITVSFLMLVAILADKPKLPAPPKSPLIKTYGGKASSNITDPSDARF